MPAVNNLSIDDLKFLLELEKHGVLLKVGAVLNMSPATSSRNFSRIADCFPEEIFASVKGKWLPTDYFQEIKANISEILEQARQLQEKADFDPQTCRRTFILTSMIAEIATIIGAVIPRILQEAPKTRIDLQKAENELSAVHSGEVDFAMVTGIGLPSDVHAMPLYPLNRVILLRKDHPLTRLSSPIKLRDLHMYERVSIRSGRSARWVGPDQDLFPNEKYMDKVRFSTDRFNTAWGVLEKTDLISVCGSRAAEIAVRGYELTALPLPEDFEDRDPWNVLIWSESHHRDPSHRWVRGLFKDWSKEQEKKSPGSCVSEKSTAKVSDVQLRESP